MITFTLCCLPLQLETQPCCLQDASKTSLSSNTLLWCLGQSVAQAKLPAQAEKRPKAEISHCQPLDVQSDMGTLVVRPPKFRESTGGPFLPVNAMGTLKTCSVWPGTENTVLLPRGLYSGRTHPYICIYTLIHKIHMHKKMCVHIYLYTSNGYKFLSTIHIAHTRSSCSTLPVPLPSSKKNGTWDEFSRCS